MDQSSQPGRHVRTVEGGDHTVYGGDLVRCLNGWTPSPGQDVGRLFVTGTGALELVRDEQGRRGPGRRRLDRQAPAAVLRR
ncbi:hypothetical protein OG894_03565 [Streptomyces sp. NBC_01724]|uniref:hypothetical protein n=1 Tax=Streptomyces sp. NBC_01724 TaxID=2975922 RepID=UPI002E3245F5|nr:hypothetical protein [Streptomyces sp. NBC_01724]